MELHLEKKEVEKIILEWAAKEMPGRFNTLIFKSYGNEADLLFVDKEEEGGRDGTKK